MTSTIILYSIVAVLSLVGAGLVRWLSDRPVKHEEYSPDEMLDELENAFAERETIEIFTTLEYLPMLFERVHLTTDAGFPEHQVAALLHRISNQRPRVIRSALFPIEIKKVNSDVELQWIRPTEDRVHMLVTAVPEVIKALSEEAEKLPAATIGS